jgi:hypothetical protein
MRAFNVAELDHTASSKRRSSECVVTAEFFLVELVLPAQVARSRDRQWG